METRTLSAWQGRLLRLTLPAFSSNSQISWNLPKATSEKSQAGLSLHLEASPPARVGWISTETFPPPPCDGRKPWDLRRPLEDEIQALTGLLHSARDSSLMDPA